MVNNIVTMTTYIITICRRTDNDARGAAFLARARERDEDVDENVRRAVRRTGEIVLFFCFRDETPSRYGSPATRQYTRETTI